MKITDFTPILQRKSAENRPFASDFQVPDELESSNVVQIVYYDVGQLSTTQNPAI